jgi:hypothetical protein
VLVQKRDSSHKDESAKRRHGGRDAVFHLSGYYSIAGSISCRYVCLMIHEFLQLSGCRVT